MDLVLFLCYFFPPLGGGGVQRSAKFVKYLPENGWHPIVVTVRPNLRNRIEQGVDYSLLGEAEDSRVLRCRSIEGSGLYAFLHRLRLRKIMFEVEGTIPLLHMDYKIGWYWPALRRSQEAIRRSPVRVIYSSSPPYSAHLVARRLKQKYGLPWVADFRDPWTLVATYRPRTRLHGMVDAFLERAIVREADVLVANTELNKANLLARYGLPGEKVRVIPNGFDPADFPPGRRPEEKEFMISCFGKFYAMRNPEVFFHACRNFIQLHGNIFLRFWGWQPREVRRAARKILPQGTWEIRGRIEHDQAVREMQRSAVLLLNLPNEDCRHWIPGKLYEYLAADRPILLIGPEGGNAAQILRETGTGQAVGENKEKIFAILESLYQCCGQGEPSWKPDREAIYRYNRRLQARELAAIFTDVLGMKAGTERMV